MLIFCFLRTAFAGGILCQSCPEDSLKYPEQCNLSSANVSCGDSMYDVTLRCIYNITTRKNQALWLNPQTQ